MKRKIVILTGAGISAESGIQTFRSTFGGKNGMWNNYKIEDVCTPDALTRNSKLVWEFYTERKSESENCIDWCHRPGFCHLPCRRPSQRPCRQTIGGRDDRGQRPRGRHRLYGARGPTSEESASTPRRIPHARQQKNDRPQL